MSSTVQAHKIRVADGLAWAAHVSSEERAKAARFRFQADADRFMAARGAVRELVGRALELDPASLRFDTGPHGKPFLAGGGALRFNVSHSGAWVLVALVEGSEVGIDVEVARSDFDVLELGGTVFTDTEIADLSALSGAARRAAFFRLWTRKEAALKAWGTGFSLDPRRVHAGADNAHTRVVTAPDAMYPPAIVQDFFVDDSHAGAHAHCILSA